MEQKNDELAFADFQKAIELNPDYIKAVSYTHLDVYKRQEVLGEGLEHASALGEGHLAQGRAAHGAGVVEHVGEVESAAAGGADEVAGDGVDEVGLLARTGDPLAGGVVL